MLDFAHLQLWVFWHTAKVKSQNHKILRYWWLQNCSSHLERRAFVSQSVSKSVRMISYEFESYQAQFFNVHTQKNNVFFQFWRKKEGGGGKKVPVNCIDNYKKSSKCNIYVCAVFSACLPSPVFRSFGYWSKINFWILKT